MALFSQRIFETLQDALISLRLFVLHKSNLTSRCFFVALSQMMIKNFSETCFIVHNVTEASKIVKQIRNLDYLFQNKFRGK